jgi:hypothetical protein
MNRKIVDPARLAEAQGAVDAAQEAATLAAEKVAEVFAIVAEHPVRLARLINIKVSTELADALADRARTEGLTQKQVICRALADIGLPADPLDLARPFPAAAGEGGSMMARKIVNLDKLAEAQEAADAAQVRVLG